MSTSARWGVARPRLKLLLCALGLHKWCFSCADRDAPRDSRRECYDCGRVQERHETPFAPDALSPWRDAGT